VHQEKLAALREALKPMPTKGPPMKAVALRAAFNPKHSTLWVCLVDIGCTVLLNATCRVPEQQSREHMRYIPSFRIEDLPKDVQSLTYPSLGKNVHRLVRDKLLVTHSGKGLTELLMLDTPSKLKREFRIFPPTAEFKFPELCSQFLGVEYPRKDVSVLDQARVLAKAFSRTSIRWKKFLAEKGIGGVPSKYKTNSIHKSDDKEKTDNKEDDEGEGETDKHNNNNNNNNDEWWNNTIEQPERELSSPAPVKKSRFVNKSDPRKPSRPKHFSRKKFPYDHESY